MINIKIRLFGAFREFSNGETIELVARQNLSIEEVKELFLKTLQSLHPEFNKQELIWDSVFASEEEILNPESRLESSCTLAILPPVCGG